MIPVTMGKTNGAIICPADRQILTQFAYARSRIKNNNITSIRYYFHAGCITTELYSFRC